MTKLLKNDRFLRAAFRERVDQTPVWMMRQAGRYLPEYRSTRKQAGDFLRLCKNSDLACEVALQPLQRYPLDAAILFSDILTIPDAMDCGLYFEAGEGPKLAHPVRTAAEIDALSVPSMGDSLDYVMTAVKTIRRELNGSVPLIGFSGSPWTLATYMIEGGGSKEYRYAKGLMYSNPSALHVLLEKLTIAVTDYLNAQIEAGSQAVQIFDTWGGVLTEPAYLEFSLAYMTKVVSGLTREAEGRRVPIILFTKGGGAWIESIAKTGCDVVGLDWTIDLGKCRERIGSKVAIQGNLDPSVLHGSDDCVIAEVTRLLKSFGPHTGHIFNLGHGINQYVDPRRPATMISAVQSISREIHSDSD